MDLGKKDGNRANFGQMLAKFNGNQKEMSSGSPNSDKVRGIPHRTEIDLNNSRLLDDISLWLTLLFG